jgi:predicted aspartyl protease
VIYGHVRDNFPYVTVPLPGKEGNVNIEFLVDTAFDGPISLPPSMVRQLNVTYVMDQIVRTAEGSESKRRAHKIEIH